MTNILNAKRRRAIFKIEHFERSCFMSIDNSIFRVPDSLVVRNYDEEEVLPSYRTEFMRDRDRVMYATAFRRLAGKTQIYTVGTDDHKKNRLTHTLEVSQIARTIASALGFDTHLTEAIALAHDFGHTPFGHAGERILHDILIPHSSYIKNSPFYDKDVDEIVGRFERENKDNLDYVESMFGFKHNLQSVRVNTVLEDSYRSRTGDNIGLNLTNFTLYGMMIHSSLKYDEGDLYPNYQNLFVNQLNMKDCDKAAWSFEAYIVKWADDIAQWHHDLEDAMREGVLPLKKICMTIQESLCSALEENDTRRLKNMEDVLEMDRKCVAELSHIVVNTLVNDLIDTSRANLESLKAILEEKNITSSEVLFKEYDDLDLGVQRDQIITFSDKIITSKFKGVIKESIHHSKNVERMNEKGKYIIRKLFEAYYTHPQQLPDGPIMHLMVDIGNGKYKKIDDAKKAGIGEVRVEFDQKIKNPTIYVQCMLMRRICDHIASMTDHYAIEEYNNLYG